MKLSAFAKIAKKTHTIIVLTMIDKLPTEEMILSNGIAMYRCGAIPTVSGHSQICALLDITQKQREKISGHGSNSEPR